MPIKVVHDGSKPSDIRENCCKCMIETPYWIGTGSSNIALCPSCAEKYNEEDLPSKEQWCEDVRAKFPKMFKNWGNYVY